MATGGDPEPDPESTHASSWHVQQTEEELELVLMSNFKLFTAKLDVWDFIPYLKEKNVFTPTDQEYVEHRITQIQRVDEMMEIIKRKGRAGYLAFFDVLQYDYPDYYKNVTKQVPKSPPKGWTRGKSLKRRTWREDKDPMSDLIKQMDQFTAKYKEMAMVALTPIQKGFKQLEDDKQQGVDRMYERLDQLIRQNVNLERALKQKDEENEKLRERNNSLQDRLDDLTRRLSSHRHASDTNHQKTFDLATSRDGLLFQIEQCKKDVQGSCNSTGVQAQLDDLVKQVQNVLSTDENVSIEIENEQLRKINDELNLRRQDLKKSNAELEKQLQQTREEKDGLMRELEEINLEYDATVKENQELQNRVRSYLDPVDPVPSSPTTFPPPSPLRPNAIFGIENIFNHRQYHEPVKLDLKIHRSLQRQLSSKVGKTSAPTKVTLQGEQLRNTTFVGGNFSGIIVDQTDLTGKLKPGTRIDEIQGMGEPSIEKLSLEHATYNIHRLQGSIELKVDEASVLYKELIKKPSPCQGDLFCSTIKKPCATCNIRPNDILLITNTMHPVNPPSTPTTPGTPSPGTPQGEPPLWGTSSHAWAGVKLDSKTGHETGDSVVLACERHPSLPPPKRQWRAEVISSFYARPMKALYKRPACIFHDVISYLNSVLPSLDLHTYSQNTPIFGRALDFLYSKSFPDEQVYMTCTFDVIMELLKVKVYPVILILKDPSKKKSWVEEQLEEQADNIPSYLWETVDVDPKTFQHQGDLLKLVKDKVEKMNDYLVWFDDEEHPVCPVNYSS